MAILSLNKSDNLFGASPINYERLVSC